MTQPPTSPEGAPPDRDGALHFVEDVVPPEDEPPAAIAPGELDEFEEWHEPAIFLGPTIVLIEVD